MDPGDTSALTLTHTRLLVPNFRECFRFYRDVLGFEVDWGEEEGAYADFRAGETILALFDRRTMAESVGCDDDPIDAAQQDDVAVVFEVDSVDDQYERLTPEVEFVTEPHDQEGWGIRVAHFRDPAGTLLEINEPLDQVEV